MNIYVIYDEVGKEFYPVFQQPNDKACALSFMENDQLMSRSYRLNISCIADIIYVDTDDGFDQLLNVHSDFEYEKLDSFLKRNGVLKDEKELK